MNSNIGPINKSIKFSKASIKKTPKVEGLQIKSLQVIPDYSDQDNQVEKNQISLSARPKEKSNLKINTNMRSIQLDNNLNMRYQKKLQNLNKVELSTKNSENSRKYVNRKQSPNQKNRKNESIISISKSKKKIDCSPVSRNIFDLSFEQNRYKSREITKDLKLQIQKMAKIDKSTKKERKKYLIQRFKIWIWASVYINRLRKYSFRSALNRKKNMQNIIIKINKPIQDIIQYYNQLLKTPLQFYIKMIKRYMQDPQFQYEQYALKLIQQISFKLSNSKITKSLVQIFKITATEKSFIPSKYLFQFQIQRLDFSQNFGCLINVTPQHTQMIIGIFLGIQIICGYILYKPWIGIQKNESLDQQLYPLYRNIVRDIGSIIYFLLKSHYEQIPLNKKNKCYLLEDVFGIETQSKLSTVPTKFKDKYQKNSNFNNTKYQFFTNQDSRFFESLKDEYANRLILVKQRLINWIKNIYTKILIYTEKSNQI